MIVSDRRVRRTSQSIGIYRIAKNFRHASIFGNDGDGVTLIGVDPNIAGNIERYAVSSFQNRVGDKNIAQAERVVGECGVTFSLTLENSLPIELNFPKCTPCSIDDKHVSLMIEGNTVGD